MSANLNRRALVVGAAALPAIAIPAIAAPAAGSLDKASAILARAEQAIDLLRTRYIGAGWKLDEQAAQRALQYFRRMAAGGPENDEEYESVCAFWFDHGQSLDWLINGDPGGLICPAAARSARAAVAATAHDPIFTAIEAHRAKNAAFSATCKIEEPDMMKKDGFVMPALGAETDAARAMFTTIPTTLARIVALVRYVAECESTGTEMMNINIGDDDGAVVLMQTLHAAFSRAVRS
jgi:hypothetical protein